MEPLIKYRELAYRVWCDCGQNLAETVRILKRDHEYEISRQSLHEWKKKYDWENRAARTEAKQREIEQVASDDGMIAVLMTQKEKYEKYFESLAVGTVDNQAIYAFNNLLKTIVDIRQKTAPVSAIEIDRPKIFLEDLSWIARALKETDPEGLKVLACNFDHLIETFKAEHGTEVRGQRSEVEGQKPICRLGGASETQQRQRQDEKAAQIN